MSDFIKGFTTAQKKVNKLLKMIMFVGDLPLWWSVNAILNSDLELDYLIPSLATLPVTIPLTIVTKTASCIVAAAVFVGGVGYSVVKGAQYSSEVARQRKSENITPSDLPTILLTNFDTEQQWLKIGQQHGEPMPPVTFLWEASPRTRACDIDKKLDMKLVLSHS